MNASVCRAPDAQPAQRRRDLVVADGAQRAPDRRCGSRCRARTARPARRRRRSTPPSARAGSWRPSDAGGIGGLIDRPFSPPRTSGNLSASAGRPTAKASVAPARYGPRSRLAAAPTGIPTSTRDDHRRRRAPGTAPSPRCRSAARPCRRRPPSTRRARARSARSSPPARSARRARRSSTPPSASCRSL